MLKHPEKNLNTYPASTFKNYKQIAMRKILHFLLLPYLLFVFTAAFAQEKTVTGKILGENNQPLMGATIRVKGSDRIVQTDANGLFSIQVKKGETLEISYVGYDKSTVKVGDGNTVSLTLKTSEGTMGEVVVTAMDIKRNPRELGYSAPKLGGNEIANTQRENFINSLQGRVAGLTINPTTGLAGASSQIVLRGFNSLSGNNQPLFVIDGVIVDNSTLNETSNGGTGLGLASDRPNRNNDYTNRIADLNPNDIESVTILKGPEATALYGSQAGSGAIIITTKKTQQSKKLNINYDNSFRFQKLTRVVDTEDGFKIGSNGIGSTSFSATSGSYFGPRVDANTPHYNNIDKFFKTGFAQTHNLALDYGISKNYGIRFSASYFDQSAVVPENKYTKHTFRISNTSKPFKWLELTPSVSYTHSTNDKPLRSAGGYLLSLYVWPTYNDITRFEDAEGNKISIFAADPYTELDNPLYTVKRNHSYDQTDRWIITGGINLTPLSWLSFSGRFGFDTYHSEGYSLYHPMSYLTSRQQLGSLDNYWRNYYGYNHTITATAKKKYKKFEGRIMTGTMWQDYETRMFAITGSKLVDSFSAINNKLYKNGQIVTDENFHKLVGDPKD
ncbi:MAG: hypothetical protein C4308_11230, partial [Chitinophagaceae bacterium]